RGSQTVSTASDIRTHDSMTCAHTSQLLRNATVAWTGFNSEVAIRTHAKGPRHDTLESGGIRGALSLIATPIQEQAPRRLAMHRDAACRWQGWRPAARMIRPLAAAATVPRLP